MRDTTILVICLLVLLGSIYLIGAKSFLGRDPATADRAIFLEYRFFNNIFEDIGGSSIMAGVTTYF